MIGWRKRRPAKHNPGDSGNHGEPEGGERFPEIDAQWLARFTTSLNGMKESAPLSVALVSSLPKEGVSLLAVNLARALQRGLNWRVALIDANLPSPALHHLSPTLRGSGLSELLRGEIAPESALQQVGEEGLGLLPAGSYTGTELAALFNRKLMSRLSPALKSEDWDAIIVDCPPLLSYPGSAFIAAQTDATVFVVRAENTRFRVANKALENLRAQGANVLGAVLNGVHFYIPEWLYRQL